MHLKTLILKKTIINKIYLDETDSNINWEDSENLENLDFLTKEKKQTLHTIILQHLCKTLKS